MSKITETKKFDDECIITLWREAFGDTREDIQFFLDECENKSVLCLYSENEELMSMLFLVDCVVNNKKSKYIYAACTAQKYRAQGLMSTLLDYAQACYSDILLIPANEPLVNYYKKRGFIQLVDIKDICFYEIEDIVEYLNEGCELDEPFALAYSKGE